MDLAALCGFKQAQKTGGKFGMVFEQVNPWRGVHQHSGPFAQAAPEGL
jgi:hypothetical protein